MSNAFFEGRDWFLMKGDIKDCPYTEGTEEYIQWRHGWTAEFYEWSGENKK